MNEFLDLMEKHINVLDDIIDTANRKFDAIAANDIETLNKCISEDEVNSMRLKGFEKKRDEFAGNFGIKTFSEYVETLQGEEREKGRQIAETLQDKAVVLKAINSTNERCIRLNLMKIDEVLDMLGSKKQTVYSVSGGVSQTRNEKTKFKSQKI